MKHCLTSGALFVFCLTWSANIATNVHGIQEHGLKFIGNMSGDVSTPGLRSIGVNAISLYVSESTERANQVDALNRCAEVEGKLLYILTSEQYNDVRMATALNGISELYWTAGRYDEGRQGFAWVTPSLAVKNEFIRSESTCSKSEGGLAVVGAMSTFGLCSTNVATRLRYICRVQ